MPQQKLVQKRGVEAYKEQQESNRLICSQEEYQELKTAFEESKKASEEQNVQYGGYDPIFHYSYPYL